MAANAISDFDKGSDEGRKLGPALIGPALMSRMEINDNKAGMDGLDKTKINQIIYDASKGSKFYENERKKEEELDLKIEKFKSYADQIGPQTLHEGNVQADLLLEKLKFETDLSHTIVHVDMDAFYAAVEMRDDPRLKSKPMAVGGMGMLSTSNYLARKFGVRAAMPGFIGLKLCPSLVIVKPNFDKYISVSHEIRKILALYDPNFCPMSLDEAYLDFGHHLESRDSSLISERTFILRDFSQLNPGSEYQKSTKVTDVCHCDLNDVLLSSVLNSDVFLSLIGDETEFQSYVDNFDSESNHEGIPTICPFCNKKLPTYKLKVYGRSVEDAVLEMRNRIEQQTLLTASAGIAPNMMLAKICSDKKKPNGQYRILPDVAEIEMFIEDLPIRKVSGIGKVTEKLLAGLEVLKCSDIFHKRSLLYHLFSPTSFHHFLSISLGIGSTTVERDDERKSISTEETFLETSDVAELCHKCEEMCGVLSSDMKKENIKGKTVTLKLKTESFEVRTRSLTLPDLTNDPSVILNTAKKLLLIEVKNSQPAPLRLRLMGVRMSKLVYSNNDQMTVNSMFNKYKKKEEVSTKCQKENFTSSFTDRFVDDSSLHEDDEDEDFSRPIILPSLAMCSQSQKGPKNDKMVTYSPSKMRKKTKNNDSLSSGKILDFFASQKEPTVQPNHRCDHGNPKVSENTLQQNQNNFDKPTKRTSIDISKENDTKEEKNPVCPLDVDNKTPSFSQAYSSGLSNDAPLTCPICSLKLSGCDLLAINSHIDSCLNRQTIRTILQDEKVEKKSQSFKGKRHMTDDQNKATRHPGKVRKVQSSVLSYFQP